MLPQENPPHELYILVFYFIIFIINFIIIFFLYFFLWYTVLLYFIYFLHFFLLYYFCYVLCSRRKSNKTVVEWHPNWCRPQGRMMYTVVATHACIDRWYALFGFIVQSSRGSRGGAMLFIQAEGGADRIHRIFSRGDDGSDTLLWVTGTSLELKNGWSKTTKNNKKWWSFVGQITSTRCITPPFLYDYPHI